MPTVPADVLAEEALLGALLLDPTKIRSVRTRVFPSHFFHPHTNIIYSVLLSLDESRTVIDKVTLQDGLTRIGHDDKISFLHNLFLSAPSPDDIETYVNIVLRASRNRSVIDLGQQIAELGGKNLDDSESIRTTIEALITILDKTQSKRSNYVQLGATLDEALTNIEERTEALANPNKNIVGQWSIHTGFRELDQILGGGFQRSDLILLAGRPGTGKTSFAMNIAINAAEHHAIVAIHSLEMSRFQLALRVISSRSGVPATKLRDGTSESYVKQRVAGACKALRPLKLYIDDTSSINLDQIRVRLRLLENELEEQGKSLDLVVIDYVQLMSGAESANRVQEVGSISRGLKQLARELNVPVLGLCQLNREVEKRENKRPILSDLAQSGQLEADADVVLFLYRDELYNPDTSERNRADVHIAKHRQGDIGHISLFFDANTVRFADPYKAEHILETITIKTQPEESDDIDMKPTTVVDFLPPDEDEEEEEKNWPDSDDTWHDIDKEDEQQQLEPEVLRVIFVEPPEEEDDDEVDSVSFPDTRSTFPSLPTKSLRS